MKTLKTIDQRYEQRPQPKGLRFGIIEVTTKCPLSCPGCYMVRRNALNDGQMDLQTAVRILDLCKAYCDRELETMDILGGEPLQWPFLKPYIEELLRRGIQPWIFTNMIPITPDLASWLYERQVHVTGKLNIDPDNQEQLPLQAQMIGRSTRTAQSMIKAIETFLEVGYRNPLFRLQNLIRKDNIGLVPDYYRWCLQKDIGTDLELMGSGEMIDTEYFQIAPGPQEIAQMILQVQNVRSEFDLAPAEVLMPHVFGSCPFFDKGLYFEVDGGIRACSNSPVRLAHIDDADPIRTAFKSPLICNRQSLCQDSIGEPCHSCNKWDACRGGCRATAEGMGDPFSGYPLCPVQYLL